MSKKERTLTSYTFRVNTAEILLCLIVFLLRRYSLFDGVLPRYILCAVCFLLWFVFGVMYSLGMNCVKFSDGIKYSFFALLPISLVSAVCTVIGTFFSSADVPSWAEFFFLGSAANFFLKPCVVIAEYVGIIIENVYAAYGAIILLLFIFSLLGCLLGINANKNILRSKKKKKKNSSASSEKSGEKKGNEASEAKGEADKAGSRKKSNKKSQKRKVSSDTDAKGEEQAVIIKQVGAGAAPGKNSKIDFGEDKQSDSNGNGSDIDYDEEFELIELDDKTENK